MNNNTNFGKDFINNVLPKLNAEEKIGLFDYTSQIEEQAKQKIKQSSQAQNAQRKQVIVNQIYNGGQPNMAGMQPAVAPMGER